MTLIELNEFYFLNNKKIYKNITMKNLSKLQYEYKKFFNSKQVGEIFNPLTISDNAYIQKLFIPIYNFLVSEGYLYTVIIDKNRKIYNGNEDRNLDDLYIQYKVLEQINL